MRSKGGCEPARKIWCGCGYGQGQCLLIGRSADRPGQIQMKKKPTRPRPQGNLIFNLCSALGASAASSSPAAGRWCRGCWGCGLPSRKGARPPTRSCPKGGSALVSNNLRIKLSNMQFGSSSPLITQLSFVEYF